MLGFFKKKDTRSLKFTGAKKLSCFSCKLYKEAHSPKMEPYGNFAKEIMVIGEAPGEREDETGLPFQGKTGRLLQRAFEKLGFDLFEDCIVLNSVNCRPPKDRQPTPNEVNCCRDVKVLKALEEYKPKVVILLGNVALRSFLGHRWKSGQLGGITKWAGWLIPDQDFKTWICPTYHPSFVERAESAEVNLIWEKELKAALGCLKKSFPVYKEPVIHFVDDLKKVGEILEDSKIEVVGFDYETTGKKPQAYGHRVVTASIAYTPDEAISFVMPTRKSERQPFIDFLQSTIQKIAANLKFEDTWSNIRLGSTVNNWIHDTMLWAHILDNRPGTTSLKFQTYVNFGIMSYEEDDSPYLKTPNDSSSNQHNKIFELLEQYGGKEQLLRYNALDSIYEYRLALLQKEKAKVLVKDGLRVDLAYTLIQDGILALARAERQGIRVDVQIAEKHHLELTALINDLEIQFKQTKFFKHWTHSVGGKAVNIDSNHQLEYYLYKVKKLTSNKKTESGKGPVDEEALQGFNIPELNQLLRIRKLKKLRDTYLKAFIHESVDGYIHPVFNLHIAKTYRSSSDSPNFQNIPVRDEEAKKTIRTCIYPRKGHQLLEIDYSQIEVRAAACYHKDPTMLTYIKDPTSDMHTDMAKQIFIFKDFDKKHTSMKALRGGAKNGFVFPQFYGDYYKNNAASLSEWAKLPLDVKYKPGDGLELPNGIHLGEHLINNGIKTYSHFLKHLQDIEYHFWNVRFPVYNNWKKKWYAQYQKCGYVDMLTGFRCSGIMSMRDVTNYPIQGVAFHCLLWSFIQMDRIIRKNKWQTKLIGQIHDSMLFDVYPPELPELLISVRNVCEKRLPAAWDWIIVPMVIEAELSDIDKSWYDKKTIDLI
jgi:uracil-DNA glycosylase family 4